MVYYGNVNELYHYGILGQKWGVRRYQNPDGSYTSTGAERRAAHVQARSDYKQYIKDSQETYGESTNNYLSEISEKVSKVEETINNVQVIIDSGELVGYVNTKLGSSTTSALRA